jgi:WD40 repeat protein
LLDGADTRTCYLDSQTSLILEALRGPAFVAAWSSGGDFLATGGSGGSVVVWRLEVLDPDRQICVVHHSATILRPTNAQDDVTALVWSSHGVLAVGTFAGALCLYKEGAEVARNESFQSPIVVLEFSKRDVLLVGCANGLVAFVSRDDAVKWKLDGSLTCGCWIDDARAVVGCENLVVSLQIAKDPVTVLTGHGDVTDVVMQQLNGLWAVADLAGTVSVFERTGNPRKPVQMHRAGVSAIAWSEVSNVYATGGLDGLVKIVTEGPPVTLEGGHQSAVYALAFDPVGRYLASADVETVNIWKIPENKLAISYRLVQCPVVGMKWSPNGRFLTVTLQSGQVSLIDFEQIC